MHVAEENTAVIRFGTYEVDVHAGELRKDGVRVRIQEQPLRVLTLLLDRPGELITREELKASLWPSGTFVEFDNILNTDIKKVREALGDSATNPRFVQTVPRRGYRFIGPVEIVRPNGAEPVQTSPAPERSRFLRKLMPAWNDGDWRAAVMGVPGIIAALALALLIMVGVVALITYFRRPQPLPEHGTIVLADFANSTGETVFDDTLKQALAIGLEQSPFLHVLPEDKVGKTLQLMRRSAGDRVTPEVAREVCIRTQSQAVVAGSILRLGAAYTITLRAFSCQTGRSLGAIQVEAQRERVVRVVGEAVSSMRARLGESLKLVQRYDVPLDEATTSSLEALQAFTIAARLRAHSNDIDGAVAYLKRAVQLDPNFARAYSALAALLPGAAGKEYANKAYELRDRVSERERFHILALHYDYAGDNEKLLEVCREWAQAYSSDVNAHNYLALLYTDRQQFGQAIPELLQALRLAPDNGILYTNLINIYLRLNWTDSAKAVFDEAQSRKLDFLGLHLLMYQRAFILENEAEIQQQLDWSAGKAYQSYMLSYHAEREAYYGRLESSRQLVRRAIGLMSASESALQRQTMAYLYAGAAWRETVYGNAGQRREAVNKAVKLLREASAGVPQELIRAAALLAEVGDRAAAESTLAAAPSAPAAGTAAVRARIELNRGNPRKALQILDELPTTPVPDIPVTFLRAEALLGLRQGAAAAEHYQKIITYRHLALLSERAASFPLAQVGLGRALAVSGDVAGARRAYEELFRIWKDASAGLPILRQAKAEYARLK